jgi:hypothetical protein
MQQAFTTVGLTGMQWLICLAMASVVLWAQEVVKLAHRTWDRHGAPSR